MTASRYAPTRCATILKRAQAIVRAFPLEHSQPDITLGLPPFDRRCSRYDPAKVGGCPRSIGWEEIHSIPSAGEHSVRLYRKRGQSALASTQSAGGPVCPLRFPTHQLLAMGSRQQERRRIPMQPCLDIDTAFERGEAIRTDAPPNIEGPYRHGSKFRCRLRTAEGRRWLPAADTLESALAAAHEAVHHPPDHPGKDEAPEEERPVVRAAPQPERQRVDPEGVRVLGPYRHEGAWRCRIVSSAGRSWAPTAATEAAALQCAEKQAAILARQGAITIRDSIAAYVRSKQVADARPSTLDGTRRALLVYFTGVLDWPVGRLTPRRAQECYDALQTWVGPRGHTLAVATHRSYVQMARSWGRWVVAKGWMRGPSPMDVVKGVGRKKRGKPQLSLDEARRLYATALDVARQGDEGGVAVLMAISMGLRTSELLSRTPRDLDNEGTVLRITDNPLLGFKAKNDSAKRPVTVPLDLQPVLARMCAGKLPTAPLFPSESRTGRRPRQWMPTQVARLCALAQVPKVCPHSLRGVSATAAAAAGALPELVAKMLGHTSPTMTTQHYIAPGTTETAQLERGLKVLTASR